MSAGTAAAPRYSHARDWAVIIATFSAMAVALALFVTAPTWPREILTASSATLT